MGDLRWRVVNKQITRSVKDLQTGNESTIDDLIAGSGITPQEVKTRYESNADTNAFTDDYKSKLEGIAEEANNYTLPAASATLGGVVAVAAPVITVDDPADAANIQAQFDALVNALKSTGILTE